MPATVPVHEKNFVKDLVVPPQLQGCKALKYEENGLQVIPVTIAVDPNCFYFFWTDQHRKSECLELSSVRDTRIGEKKARLPRDPKLLQLCLIGNATDRETPLEEKCMTIVCGNNYVDLRFVSFIFAKRSEAHFWTTELFQLAYNYKTQNLGLERTLLKIYTKLKITSSPDIRISVKDIIQYFYADKDDRKRCEKALESHKNDPILLEKFQFKDFLRLYSQIVPRPDLENIFAECIAQFGNKNAKVLTAEQLKNFLNRSQRDPRLNEILHPHATIETARALIDKYEPHESFKQEYQLSLDGFIRFLMSDSNAIISSTCYTLHQDMSQPLSHYMINSSHNTYLLGAQIKGKSSAEMYRQSLLSGCRCVELDCWNGEDGEPIITHGRTLTIPISIKEALEAIADYAFKTSDYPVILSLENRCSAQLQDKLARYLKRAFGSALLDKAVPNHPLDAGTCLPSPESLRNKILIKNKKKAPTVGSSVNFPSVTGDPRTPEDPIANNDSDTDDESDEVEGNIPDSLPADPEAEVSDAVPVEQAPVVAAVVPMVETELSALVVYVQPTRFDSFEAAKKRNRGYECVSLVEDRAMMLLKKDPVQFIDFNKRQLTRIYPNATRVKSTNFLPFFFWSSGCQLVALNVQTPDLGMQLNTAVFEFNGLTGYILKPELMRRKDRTLDPFTESHLDGVVPASLSVRVISGLMLSFKRISTFAEVDLYGIFGDIKKKDHRTRTCLNNGMNPQYDQVNQPFVFRVTLPEMAYLRISVREERTSRLIGHILLPVNQIRPGYRHVVLRNEIGQTLSATVFIFVEVKDYIPTYQIDLANALENPIRHQTEHDRRQKLDELLGDDDQEDLVNDPDAVNNGVPRVPPPGRASPLPSARVPSHSGSQNSQNGSPLSTGRPPSSLAPSQGVTRPPSAIKLPTVDSNNKLSGSNTPGTPGPKRASLVPENPDDLKAHQRLQGVRAPTLEEVKKQSKSLQKLVTKQDKEVEALQKKYVSSVRKLEDGQAKEHEKLVLDQEKSRANVEKRKLKNSAANLLPTDMEKDVDELIRQHESQRWLHLKKQAEQMAALKRDHFAKENEINRKYHELFYQTLEEELQQQQITLNEQLKTVNTVNVNEMLKKLSEQASKELHDLKKNRSNQTQLDQSRDDLKQKNVRQGVAIGKKYETMYEDRKKTLSEEMDVILHQMKREKVQVEDDLDRKFNEKCQKLEDELTHSLPNRHMGDGDSSRSNTALKS
ncbi:1-phosphatidylinositol 4,5-bisphosphate phosphodiesterase beta-1-like [Paramacrobiotus metropolitanus]|uniref:1-phosphatidylinositol 4,5-bisphosphate phosphodiesterase beta-1-like n=1 Tax=Paramacrobiotus metropolitanus TaxID=2943436 RepID=UPI002445D8A4|nr:1-phosphatidylinositol 4,5-bisphosphate phosphodiesterase beta-1-like [Paramacrobiotus metropolitanus]XP_055342780.1 1-phosphatidylinositol 4,5-bisphosphate phosphodiesterase beta-1-like [Paramacrobiotus metropolitanus]